MTTLITGGAGFCGLNIAAHLLARNIAVVMYGLEAPGLEAQRALSRLPGQFEVCIGDVCDRDALQAVMRQYDVGRVVHGAAITAALEREASQAARIIQVNIGGTIELLEAALAHGVRRVVHLSSGSVYGASVKPTGSLDEGQDVPVPDSLYGITKYAAERICLRYRATRGLDVMVARLGVVFGRWEHDTGVRDTLSIPWQLAALAEQGLPARLGASLPDDWVYAQDVAAAIGLLLDGVGSERSVYHIGTGQRWSVLDWCERLSKRFPDFSYELAQDPGTVNVGARAPVPRPPFSIDRLVADYGYTVQFNAEAAFQDYMEWRHEHRSI